MANSTYNGTVSTIDTNLFDETINAFKTAITQYREARERIFNSTDTLVTVWEGEGETAFEKAYTLLKTNLNDEEDNLRIISEDLEDMRQSYRDWDSGVAQQFGIS